MKILCGQRNCSVKLADIWTIDAGVLKGVATALTHPCGSVQRLKRGVAGIWEPPVFGHPQPHITSVMGMGVPIPLSEIWTPECSKH